MDPGAKASREIVRTIMQSLRLPLNRAALRARHAYESYKRRRYSLFYVFEDDPSTRILAFMIDIPSAYTPRPVVYLLYISAQTWYLTPSKVEPKIRKLLKRKAKYVNMAADVYMAIVCVRATRGARRVAARHGIPIRRPWDVKRDMIEYFRKRWQGLLAAIRGKRIFGELVFFVYLLQEILRELGVTVEPIIEDPLLALRIAERGVVVESGTGPPRAG